MTRSLTFRIPIGFDPTCLPTPVRDYGCWFLDLLYRKTLRLKAGDFVNLKSDYIRKVVPDRRWPGLRDRLEECGVLQCDHIDRYGKKSFGYRLAQFESQRIECKHQQLRAKLQSTDRMERSTLQPVHLHLESWLKRLTIDPRVAEATIRGMEPKTKAGTAPLTEQQYQTVIREQCLRLIDSDHRFVKVDNYGRVHTPVTSLPRQLRRHLKIDGESLVEIDISNSQPLFAGIVCRAYLTASASTQSRLRHRSFDGEVRYTSSQNGIKIRASQQHGITGSNLSSDSGNIGVSCIQEMKAGMLGTDPTPQTGSWSSSADNVDHYISTCESGLLYESLCEDGDQRDDVKDKLFVMLFGELFYQSKIDDRFRQRFPTVHGILRDLKRHNYRRAAWIMQHAEASLMIGSVCKRIMREQGDAPIITIHDSILTTPPYARYVEEVMAGEFAKLGISPTFHINAY